MGTSEMEFVLTLRCAALDLVTAEVLASIATALEHVAMALLGTALVAIPLSAAPSMDIADSEAITAAKIAPLLLGHAAVGKLETIFAPTPISAAPRQAIAELEVSIVLSTPPPQAGRVVVGDEETVSARTRVFAAPVRATVGALLLTATPILLAELAVEATSETADAKIRLIAAPRLVIAEQRRLTVITRRLLPLHQPVVPRDDQHKSQLPARRCGPLILNQLLAPLFVLP
jgi:hypothetical protein